MLSGRPMVGDGTGGAVAAVSVLRKSEPQRTQGRRGERREFE